GVAREGAVRLAAQQPAVPARDDEQGAVRQPAGTHRHAGDGGDGFDRAVQVDREQFVGTHVGHPQPVAVPAGRLAVREPGREDLRLVHRARKVSSVISLGANTRSGGPQKPVPPLVYSWVRSPCRVSPRSTGWSSRTSRWNGQICPPWVCPDSCRSTPCATASATCFGWCASSSTGTSGSAPASAAAWSARCPVSPEPPAVASSTPATTSRAPSRSTTMCRLCNGCQPSCRRWSSHPCSPPNYSWVPV